MTPYIVVACILVAMALLDAWLPQLRRQLILASLLLAAGFATLRYETGYDWLVYEAFFDSTVDIETAFYRGIPSQDVAMEPLFYGLNMLVKSIGGSFIFLLAVIAIFNCYTIHSVTSRISDNQCLIWAMYFTLAFPIAQLSIIRQSLAASFVLIALLLGVNRRLFPSLVAALIAVGFHVSAVIYAPLLFICRFRPGLWMIGLGAGIGIALLITDVRITNLAIDVMAPILPAWLSEKLPFYYQIEPAQISAGATALIAWHSCILCLLYDSAHYESRDRFIGIAIWLTLFVLAAHVFFAGFPNMWNRIMCVSIPWQLAALWRTNAVKALSLDAKTAFIALFGAAGIAGLFYTLAKPESAPLVPYHSLIQVWIYGDKGDGRLRSEDWLREHDATMAAKQWQRLDR